MSANKMTVHSMSIQTQGDQWLKALFLPLFAITLLGLMMIEPAFAGGTGTSGTVSARATSVATGFNTLMFAVGAVLLGAAFFYVGYGMAFGGKKWSDVANVCYGCTIAGAGSLIVGWLFL
jgi:TrbC/VIRB2 pilin